MYHHQQGGSSYDYSSYSAQSYEHQGQQPAQTLGRPIRPSTSQPHAPQSQQNFQSSSSYASSTAYTSAPYPAQQWQQEPWSSQQQYSQTFTSQPMHTDMTYSSTTAPRSDPSPPVSSQETRFSSSSLSQAQEPRRQDSGYAPAAPAPSHPASPLRNRRRDKESPAMAPAPSPPSGFDFHKASRSKASYNASSLLNSGALTQSRLPPAEPMERMMQSASYGMEMLQAIAQSHPDCKPSTGGADKDAPASKRQKSDEHAQEGQTCLGCNATSTPEWRRGPLGPRTLCNACGLVYAKLLKKRSRGEARSHAGDSVGQSSQPAMDESGIASSVASEDEDSYGSQERRSDFGDHGRRG
ncbi:hypothetical protein ID866_4521 [Astraeus odoratus]|nr:hypothetical protein ID866_4521 [Astraeus odoratus]